MIYGAVRRLTDRLREDAEKERQRYAVRSQAANFRRWMRSEEAFDSFAGLMTPGSLNPLGMAYEAERMEGDGARPGRFADEQEGRTPRFLEDLARAFTPTDISELQEFAFRGITPLQAGMQRGAEFAQAVQTPEEQTQMRRIGQELEQQQVSPYALGQMPYEQQANILLPALAPQPIGLPAGLGVQPEPAGWQPIEEPQPWQQLGQLGLETGRTAGEFWERLREIEAPAAKYVSESVLKGFGVPGTTNLNLTRIPHAKGVAMEVARPTNWVPIPFLDPLVARGAGLIFKAGARVAPPVLRRLVIKAGQRLAEGTLSREERIGLQQFRNEGEEILSGKITQAVADVPGGLAEPIEPVPRGEAGIRPATELAPEPAPGAAEAAIPPQAVPAEAAPLGRAVPEEARLPVEGVAEEVEALVPHELSVEQVARESTEGVGAAAAELPTQRAVEAQSARVPIEDRQAVAEEILAQIKPNARPLSVDEVAARWRDRYKSNWFTKLDDVVAKLRGRGKERAFEKAVRDSLVTRDTYRMREALVQPQRVNAWIGNNKDAFGLVNEGGVIHGMLSPDWRARGVQIREGAHPPKGAAQRLKDIFEHGEDYILTADQERGLDEIRQLLEVMKQSNFAHGVDFDPMDSATYFPGIVRNAPEGSGVPVYRLGAELSATPGWAKPRQVPTLREGLAAGIVYEDDITALTIRLTGGAEANADRWTVKQIHRLGEKPTERVSERLSENLREAQGAFKTARAEAANQERVYRRGTRPERREPGQPSAQTAFTAKAGVEPRSEALSTARQNAIEAAIALDRAKAAMRAEANRVAALRPTVFGRITKPSVAKELSRYLADEPKTVMDEIFRLWRGSMVTGDHSALLNQNLMLLYRHPIAWGKATALSTLAFKEAPYAWAARKSDAIEEAIRLGFAHPPTEFLLRQGGGLSRFFEKLPGVRQSQRGFEWAVFIGQVERYEGIAMRVKDPQELIEIAAVTRKHAGVLWTPGSTKAQARALSLAWFAPQYFASFTTAPIDLLTKSGPARTEALKSLGLMFGGAASVTIGSNMLINGEMPNIDRPEDAGFWGIRIGGGYFYPLGVYQPLVRALALSAPHKNRQGKWVKGDPKAVPRFLEGKASVPARLLLRAFEALGAPLERVRGPSYSDPTRTFGPHGVGESFADIAPVPIGAGQVVQGIRQGVPITGLEIAGGRTTVETPFQKFQRLYRERYGEEPEPDISPRQFPELAAEAGYTEPSKFEQERLRITEPEERRLGELAQIVLRGNPEAMEQFADELRDFFRFRSGVTDALVQQFGLPERHASLVQAYYSLDPRDRRDPETGEPDYDFFESEQKRILQQLHNEGATQAAQALEQGSNIEFSDPDLQRVYEAHRHFNAQLDPYYDIDLEQPRGRALRETYRRSNPSIDAILWITGRVTGVLTDRARTVAVEILSNELGVRIAASDVPIRQASGYPPPVRRR